MPQVNHDLVLVGKTLLGTCSSKTFLTWSPGLHKYQEGFLAVTVISKSPLSLYIISIGLRSGGWRGHSMTLGSMFWVFVMSEDGSTAHLHCSSRFLSKILRYTALSTGPSMQWSVTVLCFHLRVWLWEWCFWVILSIFLPSNVTRRVDAWEISILVLGNFLLVLDC